MAFVNAWNVAFWQFAHSFSIKYLKELSNNFIKPINMHPTLFLAARDGNVESLLQLLHEDPLLLERTTCTTITDNPLHISAMLGHLNFVKELLKHKRDPNRFMKELNQHGFSALHLASANGHVDVVCELQNTVNLKGKDEMTALHCAVIKGRVEVINVLLETSNLQDITVKHETAVHLAVKNYQTEALRVLLKMVSDSDMIDILNSKDDQGNTPLHLAAVRRNREAMGLLLDCNKNGIALVQANIKNQKGLTPLDLLLLFPCDSIDTGLERLLMNHHVADHDAGGQDQNHHNPSPSPPVAAAAPINQPRTYDSGAVEDYFMFDSLDTKPDVVRQNLLVVFGLFANATYQAALSPPEFRNHFSAAYFMVFNAIGFYISLHAIFLVLTESYPLFLEGYAAWLAMVATFCAAMANIPTHTWVTTIIMTVLAAALPIFIPYFFSSYRKWRKRRIRAAVAYERHEYA